MSLDFCTLGRFWGEPKAATLPSGEPRAVGVGTEEKTYFRSRLGTTVRFKSNLDLGQLDRLLSVAFQKTLDLKSADTC